MSIKGTVREDSIMHRVAEAVLTHPKKSFTVREIWLTLNNDYPDIKIGAVSHCLTKSDGPVSKLCNKTHLKEGMGSIFDRVATASMPVVIKSGSKFKPEPKPKSKPKVQPIPETVTDYQIGQSIILYIGQLRTKIKDLATAVGDLQAKNKSEARLHSMDLKQKDNTIKKLEEELKSLRAIKKSSPRTFSMKELI